MTTVTALETRVLSEDVHLLRDNSSVALQRIFPQVSMDSSCCARLVALLDDGSLEVVVELGSHATAVEQTESRWIWSDPTWRLLVAAPAGTSTPSPVSTPGCLVVPIMFGPVLYGALEWTGSLGEGSLPDDAALRAADEFLPMLAAILRT